LDLAAGVGAAGVQPYGRHAAEAAAAAEAAGLEVLRPAAVDGPVTVEHIPVGQIPLLDAHVPGLLGGTGVGFDPALVPALDRRWVMAGGLGPDNVAAAIRRLRPWGVDASSRLEAAPGRKDPDLIRRFVEEAKTA
jgi:phosphoribosylanthranilate isomerase